MGALIRIYAVVGLVGLVVGCGELAAAVDVAPALVTLRGQLVGAVPAERAHGVAGAVDLRVGLVWADDLDRDAFCIDHGRNPLLSLLPPGRGGRGGGPDAEVVLTAAADVGCADSFRFVPSRVAASAAIPAKPGASFSLELPYLPAADDLWGMGFDRVVYGSVVVWDDVDGSGTLEIIRAKIFGRPTDDGGEERGDDGDRRRRGEGTDSGAIFHPVVDPTDRDVVHGASFVTLAEPHTRVVFREGAFDTAPQYYPAPRCDPPPVGFSLMTVRGNPLAPNCEYQPLEGARIDVAVRPAAELESVACGLPRSVSGVPPSLQPVLPNGLATDCLRHFEWVDDPVLRARLEDEQDASCAISCVGQTEMAIADKRAACPGVLHFDLCADRKEGACADEEDAAGTLAELPWMDDRTTPHPDWWTCLP